MNYAPIALFTYSRADHTQRAVEALLSNTEASESDLFIFSDGPKTETKVEAVKQNREYIHTVTGFKSVTIVEREKNWGLANSLIAGITEVIDKYGKVIVVEDDIIVSPYFLKFMNEGLLKYEHVEKVSSISAFVPRMENHLPDTYFLSFFHCWGWATWKRAWDLLEKDPKILLKKIKWKKNKFDVNGGFGNYGLLYLQKIGAVDSWYIRLYASFFLAGKLTLFPSKSLITNGGMDGSGTHSGKAGKYSPFCVEHSHDPIPIKDIEIVENKYAFDAFSKALKRGCQQSNMQRFVGSTKSFIRRLLDIDSR